MQILHVVATGEYETVHCSFELEEDADRLRAAYEDDPPGLLTLGCGPPMPNTLLHFTKGTGPARVNRYFSVAHVRHDGKIVHEKHEAVEAWIFEHHAQADITEAVGLDFATGYEGVRAGKNQEIIYISVWAWKSGDARTLLDFHVLAYQAGDWRPKGRGRVGEAELWVEEREEKY